MLKDEVNLMLKDKVAFITGSTRGIGWATAKVFAQQGAKLIINGHSDQNLLDQRVAEIKNTYGVECTGILCDVSDTPALKTCYQDIFKLHKRLDILVNNAGILHDALLGMISSEDIERSFKVNAISVLENLQQAARLMSRHNNGAIVNVASIIAVRGNAGQSLYAASKSAVLGLTLAAAKELAPQGIRVNAVAPGLIDTDLVQALPPQIITERLTGVRMGRIGSPEEVANAILFLSSDLASYVTGQVLGVDGGIII